MRVFVVDDKIKSSAHRISQFPGTPQEANFMENGYCFVINHMGPAPQADNFQDTVLFLHAGNDDAADLVIDHLEDTGEFADWPFFAYLALRVCQAGGRVAFHTFGALKVVGYWADWKEKLLAKGYNEGLHFALMGMHEIDPTSRDIPEGPFPADWRVDSLKRPAPGDYLPALAILCQGFLAVHFPRGSDDKTQPVCREALKLMGWSELVREVGDELGRICPGLFANTGDLRVQVCRNDWWVGFRPQDGSDAETLCLKEWDRGKKRDEWRTVEDLMERIREDKPIGAETVAAAYLAIAANLGDSIDEA